MNAVMLDEDLPILAVLIVRNHAAGERKDGEPLDGRSDALSEPSRLLLRSLRNVGSNIS
jgi:hypothetical protein